MDTKKPNKKIKKLFDSSLILIYVVSSIVSFVMILFFIWLMQTLNVNITDINIYLLVLIVFVYGLAFGTIISVIVTKFITRDTERILVALKKVASGDFNFKMPKPHNALYKELFGNIDKMIDELNSIQMLKQDFISNFSHEFKTPLSSVKGHAEYLLKSPNLTEEQKQYVNIIISESEKLNDLSTNISLINKIDNQKIVLEENEFSLDKQIREIIASLQPILADRQINVKISLPAIRLKASEKLFRNLFTNIIGNAIKYSYDNSIIKIYADIIDDKYKIFIQDYGIGMDEITKEHIFDKFYQGTVTQSGSGLGLGLTICKKIIEYYKGEIQVESVLNQGTTICVILNKNN